MNRIFRILSVVVFVSASLACKQNLQLGGYVTGLSGELIISDGLGESLTITDNGEYSFAPKVYKTGSAYNVTVESEPEGIDCKISNTTGVFRNKNITNIEINCHAEGMAVNVCANPLFDSDGRYRVADMSIALGTGLGASGFSDFDSDDDGYREILFGTGSGFGGNSSFAVLEYDSDSEDYQLRCQSLQYSAGIAKVKGFSNNAVSAGTLIALNDGNVEILNHKAGAKTVTIETNLTGITDVLTGDVDNDGELEIAVLTSSSIAIYSAETYEFEQTIPYGGYSFDLGHLTSTNQFQLAINTGYVLQVGESTLDIVWDYSVLAFSNYRLAVGDLDQDGLDEIVGADSWYNMRVFNADTKGILWEHEAYINIDSMQIFDGNGDGKLDVIYGDGQWGGVHSLNGATGTLMWSVNNPEHGTTDVHIMDLDGDNNSELLWGAGHSSTGPDYLFIHDLMLDQREWQSPEASGPFYAVAYGDLNGDAVPDRIYASLESYRDGIVTAKDGVTGEVIWETTPTTFSSFAWTGIHALAVADVDADGENEVLVGTDRLYDGYVYILNGSDAVIEKSVALEDGSPIYSLHVEDMDEDGDLEILAGGGKEHTGAKGVYVYVIDGQTATLEHTFPSLGNTWSDLWSIDVADIDLDGTKEVLAILDGVFIVDPDNNGLERSVNSNYSSIAVIANQVYVGDSNGNLSIVDHAATTTVIRNLCASTITALEDISDLELAFTCEGKLGIYDLSSDSIDWQVEETFDSNFGRYDTLAHQFVNGRSTLQVGGSKVYFFTEK